MGLKELPITLNQHISTLRIRESQFKMLDAVLQLYPHLKVICVDLRYHKIPYTMEELIGFRDG